MKKTDRRLFLFYAGKFCTLTFAGLFLSGCKTMDAVSNITRTVSFGSSGASTDQINSLIKGGQALAHSFESFTPEQEYYIGRTLGAHILNKYPAYDHAEANFYLNILGQSLSQSCDRPETFAGYHFLIQDSEEINAFAAPGGFIFVTRGLIKCCRTEDSLAAVLAHEIAHVQAKHGLQAIKQSRLTSAFTIIGLESARHLGGRELADLTQTFGKTISDISKTLIASGYSKSLEYEADTVAVSLMDRVGYDPGGMVDMLAHMQRQLKPGKIDFGKTHPDPSDRIQKITPLIGSRQVRPQPANRLNRFKRLASLV